MKASIKRWISAGLLLVVVAAPVTVYAQATDSFDLPAQTLADSLRELGSQAHINVIFDPAAVKGHKASALRGNYAPKQALAMLLEGTGFTAEFTDARTVVIKRLPASAQPAQKPSRQFRGSHAQPPKSQREITMLSKMTVLGSLIPRSQIETASPIVIITAQQMKDRGFSSVADALQNLNLNTGAAFNNTSISNMGGSTWATKTLSLFGLPPDYVKYLINGRPMAEYSQIVVGAGSNAGATPTDTLITNLAGIPIDLVDRIEILSGGQSSLYGSDAIAGVVNIVLKQHVNFATATVRYGYYTQGGKQEQLSFTDGHTFGKLDLTAGVQFNKQDPVFDSQRRYTAQNFTGNPNSPQTPTPVAELLNLGAFESIPAGGCSALRGLYNGTVKSVSGPFGSYCGSVRVYSNGELITAQDSAAANSHISYHLTDNVDLYADLFDTYQKSQQGGFVFWNSEFYDAHLQAPVIALRYFAPSEVGNNPNGSISGNQYENMLSVAGGAKVSFGSGWHLDLNYSRANDRNTYRQYALTADAVATSYGARFLGPPVGFNPLYGLNEYTPDYNFFLTPITPSQYKGFIAGGDIRSTSRSDQFRAQLTQSSLFVMPGGPAGLAVLAESGYDSWKYLPSEGFLDGQFYNYLLSTSGGHRYRYAAAAELTLPILKQVTVDTSARYDHYDAEGHPFEHPTYSLGLEYRPVDTLLLRAKYTTSFKAPELNQEFEAQSANNGIQVIDYAGCHAAGVSTDNCNFSLSQATPYVGVAESSNPALQAITSKSVSYGAVWSPNSKLTASIDYLHLVISNQIGQQTAQSLVSQQLDCLEGLGGLTPQSPSCVAVNSQISRTAPQAGWPLGVITHITSLQYNIASSVNNSISANLHYLVDLGSYGDLSFDGAYTLMLDDRIQQLPGDPYISEFSYPVELGLLASRVKTNLSINWKLDPWSVTLFGSYIGRSPNYVAYSTGSYAQTNLLGGSEPDTLPSWTLWNLSVDYSPIKALTLSLRVNNVMNSMPPIDHTYPGVQNLPFNPAFYNPYGRQVFVEASYRF